MITSKPAASTGSLRIHGSFRVPERDFEPGSRVLDALAIVVTLTPRGGPHHDGVSGHHAWMPFRERLLLNEDVERTGGHVCGWFNLGLPTVLLLPDRCEINVVASIGPHASDVLTVQIG